MQRLFFLSCTALLLLVTACGPTTNGTDDDGPMLPSFDRKAMLEDWGNDVIVPAYEASSAASVQLTTAAFDFAAAPTGEKLGGLRADFQAAYLSWQALSPFLMGRAEEINLRFRANTYPTNTEMIEQNIATEDFNLDLTVTLRDLINTAKEEWTSDFITAYALNDGNSATASVDRTVNDYIFYYEKFLRAGKVGIPAGVFSDMPLANRAEALYSGHSKSLMLASLSSLEDFFNDRGLAEYLNTLNVMRDGELLSSKISNQFTAVRTAAENVGTDLSAQVTDDNVRMLTLYDEMQRLVVLLKVDMLQALSINVDYVDADGD